MRPQKKKNRKKQESEKVSGKAARPRQKKVLRLGLSVRLGNVSYINPSLFSGIAAAQENCLKIGRVQTISISFQWGQASPFISPSTPNSNPNTPAFSAWNLLVVQLFLGFHVASRQSPRRKTRAFSPSIAVIRKAGDAFSSGFCHPSKQLLLSSLVFGTCFEGGGRCRICFSPLFFSPVGGKGVVRLEGGGSVHVPVQTHPPRPRHSIWVCFDVNNFPS